MMRESITSWKDVIRIIDDQSSIREALQFLLEGEGWNSQGYPSAEAFIQSGDFADPGCIILDVLMPDGISGLELQKKLKEIGCDLPIIFLSAHGDIEMAVKALHMGADDFLTKPIRADKLLEVVNRAVEHCHNVRKARLREVSKTANLETLTPRELEVAKHLAQGLQNKVIAYKLGITERTVQVHRASIYTKLGVHSAAEIANYLHHIS